MKRVAILLTARPSWAKLEPLVEALRDDRTITVDLIATAYALVHRFGSIADHCRPDTYLHTALDANTLETSALTTGMMAMTLAPHFRQTTPDLVVVCADRHETLGASIAATYQNIPLLHLQGGEMSGNIDQRVRWANTMLADAHAVATERAQARLEAAGCRWVERTGCPSIDLALEAEQDPPVTLSELSSVGVGAAVDPEQPFTIVMQHPETDHPADAALQMGDALKIAMNQRLPLVVFWPGPDAGTEKSAKLLRQAPGQWAHPMHFIRTLPPRRFLKLLSQAAYAVGNSSALVREASALGVPRAILGTRQAGREYTQERSDRYGDGKATPRIVAMIDRLLHDGGLGWKHLR